MILSRNLARIALLVFAVCTGAANAAAQVEVVPPPVRVDVDSLRPPISPKRAFLTSLLFPGAAQNRLGRHKVAAGIILVETMSVAMIRESGADVREARRQLGDSLIISYVDDETGAKLTTPLVERRRFGDDEVGSRRNHVEDWIALLIANHLFAASDAFVAASLWDVNARVTVHGDRQRFAVIARIPW